MHGHPIEFVEDRRPDPLLPPGFDVVVIIYALFLVGCLLWLWPSDTSFASQAGEAVAGWSLL